MINYYTYNIRTFQDFVSQANLTWMQPVPFNINSTHFVLFKPEFVLLFYTILLLITSVYLRKFYRKKDITILIYYGNLLVLLEVLYFMTQNIVKNNSHAIFNFALVIDFYTTSIKCLLLAFTIIVLIASFKQLLNSYVDTIEFSLIVTLGLFFLLLLVSSYSMVTLYLCIEGLSLLLYILAAFPFNQSSIEAAIKYFIIGSFSSGLILFGIICIYGTTGSFEFIWVKIVLETIGSVELSSISFRSWGLGGLLFGFLFKLGLFPCHMWSVDVYEGTWLPVTSFFMVVVKMGIFFSFVRFFFFVFYVYFVAWQNILFISSIGSLFVGCIGCIGQNKLKRLFAYASISQLGFSFLGLFIGTVEGIQLSFFFFLIYIITSLGILIILLNTESYRQGKNLVYVNDLCNFGHNNNLIAISFSIMLLSMAGIPPLAGFFSKYLIFKLLIESSFYWLTIYVILISVINAFVYIRLIKSLLFDKFIIKKKFQDFFFFCFFHNNKLSFYNKIIYSIILSISAFICLTVFFLNPMLLNILYLSESSFMINSIH